MSAEERLYTVLTSSTSIASVTGTRIYPNIMPQAVKFPAISYSRVSNVTYTGLQGGSSGLENPHFQVDCWSTSYAVVKALARSVKQALDGADTFKAIPLNDLDMPEQQEDGNVLYRVLLEFSVWNQAT